MISFVSVSVSFVIAITLPHVKRSVYFNTRVDSNEENDICNSNRVHHRVGDDKSQTFLKNDSKIDVKRSSIKACKYQCLSVWSDLKCYFSNPDLLKWSIWWAIATCGNFQVGNYIQNLWVDISTTSKQTHVYNGAVTAISTIAGKQLCT